LRRNGGYVGRKTFPASAGTVHRDFIRPSTHGRLLKNTSACVSIDRHTDRVGHLYPVTHPPVVSPHKVRSRTTGTTTSKRATLPMTSSNGFPGSDVPYR